MKKFFYITLISTFLCLASGICAYGAGGSWPGVDETVVGKFAAEHGRPVRPGILELDGDALLFAFLLAGVVGGFVIGYYYRGHFSGKPGDRKD